MAKTIELTLHTFNELSVEAKERARNEWRETEPSWGWWEFIEMDWEEKLKDYFELEKDWLTFSLHGGSGDHVAIKTKYSKDKLLDEFVDSLGLSPMRSSWLKQFALANVSVSPSNWHYFQIDVGWDSDVYGFELIEQWIESFALEWRKFAEEFVIDVTGDIARDLVKEYEWLLSDEHVDDILIANEYDFLADGKMYYKGEWHD